MSENQDLQELNQEEKPFAEQIEEQRKELLAYYKKSKTLSTVNISIVLAFVIGAFILFVQTESWMKITGGSILGVAVVYMLIHYFLTKKKLPSRVKNYINFVSNAFIKHDYDDPKFKDVSSNPDDKIDQGDVLADYVYKDYSNFVSRNVVKGTYNNSSFVSGEVALYANGPKNTRQAIFVGKYISYPNNIKCKSRYIYNCRGEKEFDLPNNFDGITEIQESGHIHVYGIEGGEKNVSINKIINGLKGIRVKAPLLNMNLVIWEGHSAIYLSFDDSVMGLPFEHEFDEKAHEEQKQILHEVYEFLDSLNK